MLYSNPVNQLCALDRGRSPKLSQIGERFHKNVTGFSDVVTVRFPMQNSQSPGKVPWGLYAAATLLVVASLALAFVLHGTGTEGLRFGSRYSVRISFPFFLLAFSASALSRLVPGATVAWLVDHRRHLGLTFAWTHFLHLCIFVGYFVSIREAPPPVLLWVGGGGYVCVALLAATSNDFAQRALGRSWARLHSALMHFVWLIFLLTYALALAKPERQLAGAAGVTICLLVLGLRIASRRRRSAVGTPVPQT